ncbi:class I SAM-dependent methyltransferase [Chitinophaga nivalis]|uniref:Class I SAM-dependent methyltransferase n=1 Tax=Chitinophaga nivalis TaxID=2991709 RepID=A0ABT3IFN7_9BACT|nr:class I SAM-dependent methyltransferase [Chitinophaga nivalis]MCW3467719.1 class I SAM-dependent methyltransferase [Chitinophaga nivalis]MCW3482589.1 class I SAM-dependent methyltransferase [Chitinophaga nivalis]
MSLEHHKDATLRYQQQVDNSRNYVLPFIQLEFPHLEGLRVMEVGCGEGGVLAPLLEKGCNCVGVDLAPTRIELAKSFLEKYTAGGQLKLIAQNIYDVDFLGAFRNAFDVIILKDAIEHIPDQEKIIGHLKQLLSPRGQVYFGFPPWYMPHGGHQQICQNKLLSMMPYVHLLPMPLYRGVLRLFGEKADVIQDLTEVKSTGISIERFERIVKRQHYKITQRRFYLINPIYQYKFGVKPRVQWKPVAAIPFIRNFVTTCVYYMVKPE